MLEVRKPENCVLCIRKSTGIYWYWRRDIISSVVKRMLSIYQGTFKRQRSVFGLKILPLKKINVQMSLFLSSWDLQHSLFCLFLLSSVPFFIFSLCAPLKVFIFSFVFTLNELYINKSYGFSLICHISYIFVVSVHGS